MGARAALGPRKKSIQERSRRTVAVILNGAAQVLERRGYAAATTDAIAQWAGVSVGSVYPCFPNKEAILVALAERHVDEGLARLRALLAEVRDERLDSRLLVRRFVETMLELHRDQPRLHRVLFEEAPLPPALHRRIRREEDALAGKE